MDDVEGFNVDKMLDELLDREGGFFDHPADSGGPTRFGITEALARAHGFRGAIRELSTEEARAIYLRIYWLRPGFNVVAAHSVTVAAEPDGAAGPGQRPDCRCDRPSSSAARRASARR